MAKPNPRERLVRKGIGQFDICTKHCGAKCCRYVTVAIATPLSEADWDEMRWWLAHENVRVGKDEDGWGLEFMTRCRNLATDGACRIYESRMNLCAEHDAEDCEFTGPPDYEVLLESEEDLADYLERRRLRRGRKVAASIRTAAKIRRSSGAGGLVQVLPLATPVVSPRSGRG